MWVLRAMGDTQMECLLAGEHGPTAKRSKDHQAAQPVRLKEFAQDVLFGITARSLLGPLLGNRLDVEHVLVTEIHGRRVPFSNAVHKIQL